MYSIVVFALYYRLFLLFCQSVFFFPIVSAYLFVVLLVLITIYFATTDSLSLFREYTSLAGY